MKTFSILLGSSPYSGQDAETAMHLAEAALDQGHEVHLVASGDGTYGLLSGQNAAGAPHAGNGLAALIQRGLKVEA